MAVDCARGIVSVINCLSRALFLLSHTVNVMLGRSNTKDWTIVSVKSNIPTELPIRFGEESIGRPLLSVISNSLLAPSLASYKYSTGEENEGENIITLMQIIQH